MTQKNSLSRADFARIAGTKLKREHGKFFALVKGAPVAHMDVLRIACVVSTKTAKRAVERNLIKRRCKAAAREAVAGGAEKNSYIFYAKPAARMASYEEIKKDITSLLSGEQ